MAVTIKRSTLYKATIGVDPAGGSSYTVLGELMGDISGDSSRDANDVTLLGDAFKQKIPGQGDLGTLSFSLGYDQQDTGNTGLVCDLFNDGVIASWQITFATTVDPLTNTPGSGNGTRNFKGFITKLGSKYEAGKQIGMDIEVTLVGSSLGFPTAS